LLFGELAEGLLDELPVVLSGLEADWRNLGVSWSLPLVEPPGLLADELPMELLDKGRDVSFTACDAAACSCIALPHLLVRFRENRGDKDRIRFAKLFSVRRSQSGRMRAFKSHRSAMLCAPRFSLILQEPSSNPNRSHLILDLVLEFVPVFGLLFRSHIALVPKRANASL
jgi:hypothetical protein